MIFRGPLTDALLAALGSTGKPVGDGTAPDNGGWDGEPNKVGVNFVPYTVLTPGVAGAPTGPLAAPQVDWQMGYSLSSFGVSRSQCEWMADRARGTLQLLKDLHLNLGDTHTVMQIRVLSIGNVQRVDATNPPYWGQVDQLQVWVTKGE